MKNAVFAMSRWRQRKYMPLLLVAYIKYGILIYILYIYYTYSQECLEKWLVVKGQCPMCKTTITTYTIYNSQALSKETINYTFHPPLNQREETEVPDLDCLDHAYFQREINALLSMLQSLQLELFSRRDGRGSQWQSKILKTTKLFLGHWKIEMDNYKQFEPQYAVSTVYDIYAALNSVKKYAIPDMEYPFLSFKPAIYTNTGKNKKKKKKAKEPSKGCKMKKVAGENNHNGAEEEIKEGIGWGEAEEEFSDLEDDLEYEEEAGNIYIYIYIYSVEYLAWKHGVQKLPPNRGLQTANSQSTEKKKKHFVKKRVLKPGAK